MKSRSCESRNPKVRCPACDEIVAPLNTHVLNVHGEYADSIVADIIGRQQQKPWSCSLCPTYARRISFEERDELRRHVVARHSTAVFERFSRDHPNHSMAMRDPAASGAIVGREDDVMNSHDAIEETAKTEDAVTAAHHHDDGGYVGVDLKHAIVSAGLTTCQMAMVDCVIEDSRASKLPTRSKLCEDCVYVREGRCGRGGSLSREQYATEVSGLRVKMKDVLVNAGMA